MVRTVATLSGCGRGDAKRVSGSSNIVWHGGDDLTVTHKGVGVPLLFDKVAADAAGGDPLRLSGSDDEQEKTPDNSFDGSLVSGVLVSTGFQSDGCASSDTF